MCDVIHRVLNISDLTVCTGAKVFFSVHQPHKDTSIVFITHLSIKNMNESESSCK